jgi:Reverse transcriptase (RNA-dependent DNA polymerase).
MYPFFGFHRSFRQNLSYISTSDVKESWIKHAFHHTHTSNVWSAFSMVQINVMITLQAPFPYDVPLDNAVQWACYYSRWCWILCCICWSEILQVSELDIAQRKPRWWLYADDVTIFVTAPEEIQLIGDILRTYEKATGACLNIRKSRAMAAGSWDTSINMIGIPHYPEITILGFRFMSTVARYGNVTWSRVTRKVKAPASHVYGRDLCLTQPIQ